MKKTILPVIHVETEEQALRNATIAKACGADGVFIISHGYYSADELYDLALKVKKELDGFWVGVNCLDLTAEQAMQTIPLELDGLWTDNAHIEEDAEIQKYAKNVWEIKRQRGWHGKYFGGVAFKYQRKVSDLDATVEKSKPYMEVICTSGDGTGIAADLEKVKKMKQAAGDFPLAIASGITPENISEYLPYIDHYLVATGIGKSFTEIDEKKLKKLIAEKNLYRFVEVQNSSYCGYAQALSEIKQGCKSSHWMWYIFPQFREFAHSTTAYYYGIVDGEEARDYFANSILRGRLYEITTALLMHKDKDIVDIFGTIDAGKLRSCMTMFDFISPNDVFGEVLDVFYKGQRGGKTLKVLNNFYKK